MEGKYNKYLQESQQKIYIIWKLKQFGLKEEELLTAWTVMLRPIAEYTVPLWHSGLTDFDSDKLEALQKRALGLILGTVYEDHRRYYKVNGEAVSYLKALIHCNLTTLKIEEKYLLLSLPSILQQMKDT